jgi:isoleucyl-tRNA synthetase
MGADPMRYLYCSQPVTSDLRFGYTLGDLAKRKLANLWNIYVFFTTYALIDEPDLGAPCPDDALHITDRWLRARTAAMRDRATAGYDNWDTPAVIREVEEYLDDVSNWYVRLNRRRFWRAGHAQDKRACYGTLLSALDTVVRVLAPITPFLSESIWQNAVRGLRPGATDSVHRAPWPEQRPDWRDDVLLDEAAFVRDIVVNMARNVREVAQLRVRQPLRTMYVVCPEERWPAIERHRALIKTELNVKNLEVMASSESLEQPVATLNFRAAGPVLRGDVNTVKDLLAKLDPERMEGVAAQVEAGGEVEVPGWDGALPAGIFEIGREPRSHLRAASQAGVTVALDTRIDDDLRREGTARDLVHHLQYLRKDRDLELTERVMLAFDTNSAFLQSVIQGYRDYIMEEVLAVDLEERDMAGNGDVKTLRLGGEDLHIALQPMERDGQQA